MNPPRRKQNSTRVSLVISLVFHSILVSALFFFAAREGLLGKQLKKIAVTMAPKEKPPEKPKEAEPPPQPNLTPQETTPQVAQLAPPPPAATASTPPPAVAPAVAPPAAALPSLVFEGGATVKSSSDPVALYKGFVEYLFRSRWNRPDGIPDENFVAEVDVTVDPSGKVTGTEWKRGSGNGSWDDSVKRALAQVPQIGRKPPKGFPERFLVRFDVQPEHEIALR